MSAIFGKLIGGDGFTISENEAAWLYGVKTLKKIIENKILFQLQFADNFHPKNIEN